MPVHVVLRHLVDIHAHRQIDIHCALPCVNAPAQDPHSVYGAYVDAPVAGYIVLYCLFRCCLLRQHTYLEFMCHMYADNVKFDFYDVINPAKIINYCLISLVIFIIIFNFASIV